MKLTLTLTRDSYEKMVEDNVFVDKDVWVATERFNKDMLRDGEISDDEVIIHVTVDSIYFADDVLKLYKQEIPEND